MTDLSDTRHAWDSSMVKRYLVWKTGRVAIVAEVQLTCALDRLSIGTTHRSSTYLSACGTKQTATTGRSGVGIRAFFQTRYH